MFCPNCGQKNDQQSRFCTGCGTSLVEVQREQRPLPYRAPPSKFQSFLRSIGETLSLSFEVYKQNFVTFCGFSVLFLFTGTFLIVAPVFTVILLAVIPSFYALLPVLLLIMVPITLLCIILGIISSTVARAGIVHMTDRVIRKRMEGGFSISRVFHAVKRKVLSIIAANIIISVIQFTVMITGSITWLILIILSFSLMISTDFSFPLMMGSLLILLLLPIMLVVISYYFMARFAFIDQIIILEDQGALEAVKLSGKRTSGQKWKIIATLYILSMIQGFVINIGIFVLIIPLVILIITIQNIFAIFFAFLVIATILILLTAAFYPLQGIALTIIHAETFDKGLTGKTLEEMRQTR